MQRKWTTIGKDHNGTPEARRLLAGMFDRLDWKALPQNDVPMMPGEGIKIAIQELRIPNVNAVAWSNELGPYGLYGIRGRYKNGRADVFICDEGSVLVVLATDFYPNKEEETPCHV